MLRQECTAADTVHIAAQARAAYEQKRTRECLTFLATLGAIDPEHPEIAALSGAIRIDIYRDLNDARALLTQAGSPEERRTHRKAAELILLKAICIDPQNDEGRSLLDTIRNAAEHEAEITEAAAVLALERQIASAVSHVRVELISRWDAERAQLVTQRDSAARAHQEAARLMEHVRRGLEAERDEARRLLAEARPAVLKNSAGARGAAIIDKPRMRK
jgi:hypothetical protein